MNNKFEQPKKGSLSLQDLLQTVLHLISTKKFWIELFIMTFGMFVAALGLHFFLIPSKFDCWLHYRLINCPIKTGWFH